MIGKPGTPFHRTVRALRKEAETRHRGMIFDAESVSGILARRKSKTRRVVKPQPWLSPSTDCWCWASSTGLACSNYEFPPKGADLCPYGEVGDRIWVRETFRFPEKFDGHSPAEVGRLCAEAYQNPWCPTRFEADGAVRNDCSFGPFGRKRSAMHMPRWASRLTLEITDVRAERLWSVTEEDALAEGILPFECVADEQTLGGHDDQERTQGTHPYTIAFAARWDDVNASRGFPWKDNPWVWVVGFRVAS